MRRSSGIIAAEPGEAGAGPHRDGEARGRARGPGLVDEVQGEEADEDVEQQVGELEQQQPAQHLAPRDRAQRLADAQPLAAAAPTGAGRRSSPSVSTANAPNSARHPSSTHTTAASSSGPPIAPIDPATVQRAMLCSRRSGSRSDQRGLRAARRTRPRPGRAPRTPRAASRPTCETAARASAPANASPPPSTSARRRHVTATSPSTRLDRERDDARKREQHPDLARTTARGRRGSAATRLRGRRRRARPAVRSPAASRRRRRAIGGWSVTREDAYALPQSRPAPSVQARVERHRRDQRVLAALAVEHGAPARPGRERRRRRASARTTIHDGSAISSSSWPGPSPSSRRTPARGRCRGRRLALAGQVADVPTTGSTSGCGSSSSTSATITSVCTGPPT